ncbi:hypothetical protein [Petroclostridium sp. X23]|nr:hypothetical protein [Petroclostridium sp. X23]WHH60760.1 hypothetical protein QKW49_08700 [Petroclostridium sp. X23]
MRKKLVALTCLILTMVLILTVTPMYLLREELPCRTTVPFMCQLELP